MIEKFRLRGKWIGVPAEFVTAPKDTKEEAQAALAFATEQRAAGVWGPVAYEDVEPVLINPPEAQEEEAPDTGA